MKNILDYYYRMIVDENEIDSDGCFSYNSHLFYLQEYQRGQEEIKALLFLNNYMLSKQMKINKIIINIYNEPITIYDDKKYVLIEILYQKFDENKSGFYLAPIDNKITILNRYNWGYLWSKKIDYVEYQVEHFLHKYPILSESVNYYIGMSENAIMYFNMLKLDQEKVYINHRRINEKTIYNPLELVFDYKVRDISEYIKMLFFKKRLSIDTIVEYIMSIRLENIDYVLLYVRLIFPTYYFDMYDGIINNSIKEETINSIIELNELYEELLYKVYVFIKKKVNIIGLEWINSKY